MLCNNSLWHFSTISFLELFRKQTTRIGIEQIHAREKERNNLNWKTKTKTSPAWLQCLRSFLIPKRRNCTTRNFSEIQKQFPIVRVNGVNAGFEQGWFEGWFNDATAGKKWSVRVYVSESTCQVPAWATEACWCWFQSPESIKFVVVSICAR